MEIISLESFEAFFKDQYAKLCGLANHYLNDLEASEDLVQGAFVKLWEQREMISIEHSMKAYMRQSVRNSCLNQLKHLKVRDVYKEHNGRELELNSHAENEGLISNEIEERVNLAIEKLPEGRRKIFLLSRFEGLKYREIAERLNVSIKTVENQMGSALKQLKEELSEYMVISLFLLFQIWN